MLVIGPLHLEADADEDAEVCVSRDDEYILIVLLLRGIFGLEMN